MGKVQAVIALSTSIYAWFLSTRLLFKVLLGSSSLNSELCLFGLSCLVPLQKSIKQVSPYKLEVLPAFAGGTVIFSGKGEECSEEAPCFLRHLALCLLLSRDEGFRLVEPC